ncbi:hypothetical protein PCANC_11085 [Puccinia coronata f. sp. avenae]|uniref:Uncharacterized protein n=1 Tax=Puccinia coronata f. sp. avenae TaxID=200324 RepID=A0A2N5UW11_9BASI|nr:hypothetical protein PCANC_11085 [Puccinia coronata f. sp. avenae]
MAALPFILRLTTTGRALTQQPSEYADVKPRTPINWFHSIQPQRKHHHNSGNLGKNANPTGFASGTARRRKINCSPPDKPSTSLLALLPASPADDSFDPADVPPLEALDEKESDINDSLPNSSRSGNANEDVSAPSFINNCDPIPNNNLIANKPDSVADKAPSPPGNTAPLKVISNIEGYNFTTGGPLDPPPPARFGSMDDLVGFCQSWAKNHGYAIAKSNSHPGKNVYIKCD